MNKLKPVLVKHKGQDYMLTLIEVNENTLAVLGIRRITEEKTRAYFNSVATKNEFEKHLEKLVEEK